MTIVTTATQRSKCCADRMKNKVRKSAAKTFLDIIHNAPIDDFEIVPRQNAVWYSCTSIEDLLLRGLPCKIIGTEYIFDPQRPFEMIFLYGSYAYTKNKYARGDVYVHDKDNELTLYFTIPDRTGMFTIDKKIVMFTPTFGGEYAQRFFDSIDPMDRRKSLWGF